MVPISLVNPFSTPDSNPPSACALQPRGVPLSWQTGTMLVLGKSLLIYGPVSLNFYEFLNANDRSKNRISWPTAKYRQSTLFFFFQIRPSRTDRPISRRLESHAAAGRRVLTLPQAAGENRFRGDNINGTTDSHMFPGTHSEKKLKQRNQKPGTCGHPVTAMLTPAPGRTEPALGPACPSVSPSGARYSIRNLTL